MAGKNGRGEVPSIGPPDQSGAAPPPILARRTPWIELLPPYEGLKLRVWVNFPRRIRNEFREASTEPEIQAVMKQIVLEHNSWRNEDGEILPTPQEDEFWDLLPDELMSMFLDLLRDAMDLVPNSLRRNDTNSPVGTSLQTSVVS